MLFDELVDIKPDISYDDEQNSITKNDIYKDIMDNSDYITQKILDHSSIRDILYNLYQAIYINNKIKLIITNNQFNDEEHSTIPLCYVSVGGKNSSYILDDRYLCRYKQGTYIESTILNQFYMSYINQKIKNKSFDCDQGNYFSATIYNLIYLDGDYTIDLCNQYISSSDDELKSLIYELNITACNVHLSIAKEYLDMNNFKYNYYLFIPKELTKIGNNRIKGGYHIYILLNKNLFHRNDINNYIKNKYLNDGYFNKAFSLPIFRKNFNEIISKNIENCLDDILDSKPLMSCSGILPFGKKQSDSRIYTLFDYKIIDDSIQFNGISYTKEKLYKRIDKQKNDMQDIDNQFIEYDQYINIKDKIIDEYDEENIQSHRIIYKCDKSIYAFINALHSLLYILNKNHPFWKNLSLRNGDLRIKLLSYIYDMFVFTYIVKNRSYELQSIDRLIIYETINVAFPLLQKSCEYDPLSKGKRKDFQNILNILIRKQYSVFYKIFINSKIKVPLDKINGDINLDPLSKTQIKEYTNKILSNDIDNELNSNSEDKFTLLDLINHIKNSIQYFMSNICWLFCNEIVEQLSSDIECVSITNEHQYQNIKQIKYFIIYIYILYGYKYNWKKLKTTCTILFYLCKYYILIYKGSDKIKYYFYNTRLLESFIPYPYNQWIIDEKNVFINDLYKFVYTELFDPTLYTTNNSIYKISYIKNILNIITSLPGFEKLEKNFFMSYDNISELNKKISENLSDLIKPDLNIVFHKTHINCGYIPVRSGIIRIKIDCKFNKPMKSWNYEEFNPMFEYSYEFSKDNRNIVLDHYSNVPFEYETSTNLVNKMLRQILSDNKTYNYVLSYLSYGVHSLGDRDMLFIAHGSGSDGKTVLSTMYKLALGKNISETVITENIGNKKYTFKYINPNTFVTTMSANALIEKSNHSSSHNEGGKANLNGARVCIMEEPENNSHGVVFNSSLIKELTGGGEINARRIYQSSEQFKPNALLFLAMNNDIEFTEADIAMRRRIVAYRFEHKFVQVNMTNDIKIDNQTTFLANDSINEYINNPKHWSAFFSLLLSTSLRSIGNYGLNLSSIPMTSNIKLYTNNLFERTIGIDNIFNSFIKYNSKSYYTYSEIYDIYHHKPVNNKLLQKLKNKYSHFIPLEELGDRLHDYFKNIESKNSTIKYKTKDDIMKQYLDTIISRYLPYIKYYSGEDGVWNKLKSKMFINDSDIIQTQYAKTAIIILLEKLNDIKVSTNLKNGDDYKNIYILNHELILY